MTAISAQAKQSKHTHIRQQCLLGQNHRLIISTKCFPFNYLHLMYDSLWDPNLPDKEDTGKGCIP